MCIAGGDCGQRVTWAPTVRQSELAEAWDASKETTSIAVLEAFVARYKDTFYAELARARIEELKRQKVVIAPRPNASHPGIGVAADLAAIGKRFATGSRAGSDVTVTSASGIDSKLAWATGEASPKDNEDYCENGKGHDRDSTEWRTCLAEIQKLPKQTFFISANCALGTVKLGEAGTWLLPDRSKAKSADCQANSFWIVEGRKEEVSWQTGVQLNSAFRVLCPKNSQNWFIADKQC